MNYVEGDYVMLQAGFYEKNITPPLGCHIPGFFVPRIADDVLADLYARAAVVYDGKEKVAMLALDMCTVNSKMTNAIIERAHEFTGIKKENILICATHLHTGAPTDKDTFIEPDLPYVDYMIRLAADAITLADIMLKPVTAKYAQGHVDSIAFVRNYNMNGGFVMTNPFARVSVTLSKHCFWTPKINLPQCLSVLASIGFGHPNPSCRLSATLCSCW